MRTPKKFKSRKLFICGILFVTSTVFMALEMATFPQWADFNIWVFSAYTLGNVGEHYTKNGGNNGTSKV